jgi:glycine/D-amino acid oxidase-like deaminating enzyme
MVVLISSLAILSSSIVCLALLSPIKSPRLLIHTTGTITGTSTTSVATINKRSVVSHSTTTTSPAHKIISSTSFPSFMTTRTAASAASAAATTTLDDFKNASHRRRRPQHIIIAGAGIIGTSTAYYLSKLHHEEKEKEKPTTTTTTTTTPTLQITIIDPTGTIAPAASGKVGGFLALDWNDFSPHALGPLARRGFELHSILAQELGQERIQYRRLSCACISVSEQGEHDDDEHDVGRGRPSGKKLEGIAQEWNHDNATVLGVKQLGDERTIAQVHPKMLCCAMWEDMNDKMKYPNVQVQLVKGKVIHAKPSRSGSGNASGILSWDVHLQDGTILTGDAILYACGPWTTLGNCITGVKYHSVIIPTRPKVLSQAIFYNGLGDPEVYPRSDGTAYCCGFPDPPVVVKEEPGREEVRQEKVDEIVNAVRVASGSSSSRGGGGGGGVLGQEPDIVQSCYLPCTPDNIPMMGKVMVMDQKDESSSTNIYVDGCYVAAGHGCWGILMGPATGEAMAKLILTGEESSSEYVNLTPFSPQRFLLK